VRSPAVPSRSHHRLPSSARAYDRAVTACQGGPQSAHGRKPEFANNLRYYDWPGAKNAKARGPGVQIAALQLHTAAQIQPEFDGSRREE